MFDSFATPWTIALQAPLSMGFPRQKYWNGLPFPSPGDLPDPGIKPRSLAMQVDSLLSEPLGKPRNLPLDPSSILHSLGLLLDLSLLTVSYRQSSTPWKACSFHKYVSRTYYEPRSVVDTGDPSEDKTVLPLMESAS